MAASMGRNLRQGQVEDDQVGGHDGGYQVRVGAINRLDLACILGRGDVLVVADNEKRLLAYALLEGQADRNAD